MVFLSLITRYFDEPFIEEFVQYYLSEGVDVIYILFDIKSTIPIPRKLHINPKVFIIEMTHFGDKENLWEDTNILYSKVRHTSDWFIYVDCDEFINTRKHENQTIRNELLTTFKHVDCIKIPWIMMSCNKRHNDPPSILQCLVYRWNHNNKHPHPTGWFKGRCRYHQIQVKCIFKSKTFDYITDHCPKHPYNKLPFICVDSVYNKPSPLNSTYNNLREHDINTAFFVCHHYRVISRQSCKRKFTNNALDAYKSNFKNLWLCDYAEVIDETLKRKSIQKFGLIQPNSK